VRSATGDPQALSSHRAGVAEGHRNLYVSERRRVRRRRPAGGVLSLDSGCPKLNDHRTARSGTDAAALLLSSPKRQSGRRTDFSIREPGVIFPKIRTRSPPEVILLLACVPRSTLVPAGQLPDRASRSRACVCVLIRERELSRSRSAYSGQAGRNRTGREGGETAIQFSFRRMFRLVAVTNAVAVCGAAFLAPGAAGRSYSAKCRAGQGTPWRFVYPPDRKSGFVGHWYQITVDQQGPIDARAPVHLFSFIRSELKELTRVKNRSERSRHVGRSDATLVERRAMHSLVPDGATRVSR
jgi:hypothetical protein